MAMLSPVPLAPTVQKAAVFRLVWHLAIAKLESIFFGKLQSIWTISHIVS